MRRVLLRNASLPGTMRNVPESPTNPWDRAHQEAIERERTAADEFSRDHPFLAFPVRELLMAAGLGAIVLGFIARAVGLHEGWVFWVTYIVLFGLGSALWLRDRDRKVGR